MTTAPPLATGEGSFHHVPHAEPLPQRAHTPCPRCGYDVHGLPARSACPQCAVMVRHRAAVRSAQTARRVHAALLTLGLALLVYGTLSTMAALLHTPFRDKPAGTVPIFNFAGPKLPASGLLQRPLGTAPESPGVQATMGTLVCAGGLWLITVPMPMEPRSSRNVRRTLRVTMLLTLGPAVGVMLAVRGIHTGWAYVDQRGPWLLALIGLVELPVTGLLWVYLTRLSETFTPRHTRAFRWSGIAAVVTIAASLAALLLEPASKDAADWIVNAAAVTIGMLTVLTALPAYGCVGVLALAAATCAVGEPSLRRPGRMLSSSGDGLRRITLALISRRGEALLLAGAALWMYSSSLHLAQVLTLDWRTGFGSNLPKFSVPGLRFWADEIGQIGGGGYDGVIILGVSLQLLAVWAMTSVSRGTLLGVMARWWPIVMFAVLGTAYASAPRESRYPFQLEGISPSQWAAIATVFLEAPATLLLVLNLSAIAGRWQRPTLSRALRRLGLVLPVLICLPLACFVLSKWLTLDDFQSFPALCAFGVYGAMAFSAVMLTLIFLLQLMAEAATRVIGVRIEPHGLAT